MQTLAQIRQMLEDAGLAPQRMFGQNFLIDQNLMGKLLELANIEPGQTVLEVGPGTGSLTEELLGRASRVVAVEIDRGLHALLAGRFAGQGNLTLVHADALAGKHAIAAGVLAALGPRASLVANLPYNIATPLIAQCLIDSWRTLGLRPVSKDVPSPSIPAAAPAGLCRFDSLTFTVQREVGDRLAAALGSGLYGPLSVLVHLLARPTMGPVVPAESFWPRPNVSSRILRIDFDHASAARVGDVDTLSAILFFSFNQRRKQISSMLRREDVTFSPASLAAAMEQAGVDPKLRAEQVSPEQFLALANALSSPDQPPIRPRWQPPVQRTEK